MNTKIFFVLISICCLFNAAYAQPSCSEAVKQGFQLLKQGNFTEAASTFEKALENDPKCADAYLGLGDTYALMKQNKKAISYFENALTLSPGNLEVLMMLGNVYKEIGDNQKAKDSFQKALDVSLETHNDAVAKFAEDALKSIPLGQE